MEIQGKVALITGGTHGIGAETTIKLAKGGAKICIVARDIVNAPVIQDLKNIGATYYLIKADLSEETACKRVVEETVSQFNAIDIFVHCAGSAAPGGLLSGAREVWYSAFDIHVHAIFHLCLAIAPFMQIQGEGAIILISSAAGLRGVKNALAYAVVKGAIPQFARTLALELSDKRIRVNCVSPGVIRTRFQDYLTDRQVRNNIENRIPIHSEGTPEEVADAILMLIRNNFITGENLVIDGGMTMRIV
ncbi:MAG: SDR family oxidoreductase [Chitinophagaceae bacterium]|nr:MAG: SDR family oxidoreductase [Chitinophagaceae bacterium]